MAAADLSFLAGARLSKAGAAASLVALPWLAACAHGAGTGEASSLAEPVAATAPVTPPIERPEPVPPPPAEEPSILVEIEPAPEEEVQDHRSLVEASRAARAKRQTASATGRERKAIAVINNENLGKFAEAGELTYAEGPEADEAATGADAEGAGVEDYWRDRSARLREDWRRTVEERQEVEDRAALLRRRFYAEDDPFVRDGQIKPEWDQALERLAELRQEEESLRTELDDLLEEGALAGADPSWLDDGAEEDFAFDEEGLEEEDSPEAADELEAHEVQNPPF